jgi:hypothetical protein
MPGIISQLQSSLATLGGLPAAATKSGKKVIVKEIKLVGRSFGEYTNPFYSCDQMRWKFVSLDEVGEDDLVVFNNQYMEKGIGKPVRMRIGWLLESRGIAWPNYSFIEDNLDKFDVIFTCDDAIVSLDPLRCIYVPRGGCWIKAADRKIYDKSRFISFISSAKGFDKWSAIGHGLRTDLYYILTNIGGCLGARLERAGLKNRIDCYGTITGHTLPEKVDSLKDYMFQIAVENMINDTYFTEKLTDCFATGTVPIFRGTRRVDRFFDPRGIIFFDSLEELTDILINLTEDDYYDRMDAINENFHRLEEFLMPEDWLCRYTGLLNW